MFAPTLTLPYLTTPSFSRSLSHSLLAQVGRGTHTHPQRGVHLVHLPIRLKIQKKSIACSNCLKKTENSCLGAACCNQPMKKKKNKKKQNILTNRRFCVCVCAKENYKWEKRRTQENILYEISASYIMHISY